MRLTYAIEKVRHVGLEHLEEFETAFHQDLPGRKAITFFSREIEAQTIHGGNGDRTTDRYIALDKDGWLKYKATVEFGSMVSGGWRLIDYNTVRLTDQQVEDFLNSQDSHVAEVIQFIDKYNEIASKYPRKLEKLTALSAY